MISRVLFLACLGACACAAETVDLCSTAPDERSCITLHLRGDIPAFDTVQVDIYSRVANEDRSDRITSRLAGGATSTTPAAVGIILPANRSSWLDVTVIVFAGQEPVGFARQSVYELGSTEKKDVEVTLDADLVGTQCYVKQGEHHVRVMCGTTYSCGLCNVGDSCFDGDVCVTHRCDRASGESSGKCY